MDQKTKIVATVVSLKGTCSAGHKPGDSFALDCLKTGGLCGFFYHELFPTLAVYQYGGKFPWWRGETLELSCPDRHNDLVIKLEKKHE